MCPNVPGPVAAARLRDLGASVVTIEPPTGDPLASIAADWYADLHAGMTVERVDRKTEPGIAALAALLAESDVSSPRAGRRRSNDSVSDGPTCTRVIRV